MDDFEKPGSMVGVEMYVTRLIVEATEGVRCTKLSEDVPSP